MSSGMFNFPIVPFGTGFYNPWSPSADFDRSVKSMEKELWDAKRSMDRTFRSFDNELGRDYSSALVQHPSRPSSMIEHYSLLNPIRIDAEGNRWLNCYFDLRSFKAEEINVTLNTKERCIFVEASHEVKDSKEHYIKRHYSRKVFLPEDLKIDLSKVELKSCLTNEGLLCVEAPLPKLSIEEARTASSKSMSTVGNVYPINVKVHSS